MLIYYSQNLGLAPTGRPGEILKWIKSGRKTDNIAVQDIAKFNEAWLTWWEKLNVGNNIVHFSIPGPT